MPPLHAYTREEVQKHDTPSDGWLIIDDWVVTSHGLLTVHPGGTDILVPYLGKDASDVFHDPSVHVHSKASTSLLNKFIIGYVKGTKKTEEIDAIAQLKRTAEEYGVKKEKGLLWQVSELGDSYDEFIHNVLIMEGPSLKLFDHPLLELTTRSPWYTVPLVWIPLTVLTFWVAANEGLPLWIVAFFFLAGPFMWNFIEYEMHKNVFHMSPKNKYTRIIHFLLHGYHHLYPNDHLRLTFPPVPAFLIACMLYYFTGLCLLPLKYGLGVMGGIFTGYIYYDLTHYYLHHGSPFLNFTKYLKTHHLYHHYRNDQYNFGISMWLFDTVFNTHDPVLLQGKRKKSSNQTKTN